MAKKLDEIIKKLPQERQNKIEARSQELIAEYMTYSRTHGRITKNSPR